LDFQPFQIRPVPAWKTGISAEYLNSTQFLDQPWLYILLSSTPISHFQVSFHNSSREHVPELAKACTTVDISSLMLII